MALSIGWFEDAEYDGSRYPTRFYVVEVNDRRVWEGQSATIRDAVMLFVDGWTAEDMTAFDAEGVSLDDLIDEYPSVWAWRAAVEQREQSRSERAFEDSLNPDNGGPSITEQCEAAHREREQLRGHY